MCLDYGSKMTWKIYLTWVVILVVSGKVVKLELGRLPIRHNGGKGKFVTLVVSRIRHFTYAPHHVSSKMVLGRLGSKMGLGRLGSKIALGRLQGGPMELICFI